MFPDSGLFSGVFALGQSERHQHQTFFNLRKEEVWCVKGHPVGDTLSRPPVALLYSLYTRLRATFDRKPDSYRE